MDDRCRSMKKLQSVDDLEDGGYVEWSGKAFIPNGSGQPIGPLLKMWQEL